MELFLNLLFNKESSEIGKLKMSFMSQMEKLHICINGIHSLGYGPKLLLGLHRSTWHVDLSQFDRKADLSPDIICE